MYTSPFFYFEPQRHSEFVTGKICFEKYQEVILGSLIALNCIILCADYVICPVECNMWPGLLELFALTIGRPMPLSHINPVTPESDQCQNYPAASQEIWHHTVWRTWLFIAYSDEKWLCYKFSLHHSYNRFLKGWENTLFELRSERVKLVRPL